MRPGSRERIPTVEEAVTGAARLCDPEPGADGLSAFVRSFEGDDRPATASADLIGELRSTADSIDPEGLEPAVHATAATAAWIATNPSSVDDPETAIREGVRLFYSGKVPASVSDWLVARGIDR